MNVTLVLSAVIALISAALYLVSAHAKVSELARIAFFCGLLVALWTFGNATLSLR